MVVTHRETAYANNRDASECLCEFPAAAQNVWKKAWPNFGMYMEGVLRILIQAARRQSYVKKQVIKKTYKMQIVRVLRSNINFKSFRYIHIVCLNVRRWYYSNLMKNNFVHLSIKIRYYKAGYQSNKLFTMIALCMPLGRARDSRMWKCIPFCALSYRVAKIMLSIRLYKL